MRNSLHPVLFLRRIGKLSLLLSCIACVVAIPKPVKAGLHPPRVITGTYKEDIDGNRPFKCWREENCWWTRSAYSSPKPYVVTTHKDSAREWYKRQRI
ncbi:MAG: hypothetical protein O3A01_03070 [bacterium]|nr:hypothetical protein [bacterium]